MSYRIHEVEEVISKLDLSEVADDTAEIQEDMQLVLSGWHVYIPELNVILREGIICTWEETEQLFMPSYKVTVVSEGIEEGKESGAHNGERQEPYKNKRTNHFPEEISYVQDEFIATLETWLHGTLSSSQIEQLRCELVIP